MKMLALHDYFRYTWPSVVIGAHARTIGAGRAHCEQIASLHLNIKASEAGYAAGIPISPP